MMFRRDTPNRKCFQGPPCYDQGTLPLWLFLSLYLRKTYIFTTRTIERTASLGA